MSNQVPFETLRASLSETQRQLLSAIWTYYCKHNKWIRTGTLHHDFGKATVLSAFKDLGGTVVYDVFDSGIYRYQLTFLGILLSYASEEAEQLLARYLNYLKEQYLQNPEFDLVKGQELETALGLTPDQCRLLGRLVYHSSFHGGGGFGESDWQTRPPSDIDDFPTITDFRTYIRNSAMQGFNPSVPVGERERTLWHSQNSAGAPNWMEGPMRGHDVFIVHGRDKSTKETVARFIENLGLRAVILHEKPNSGRTIIEKFEDFSNVGFAVVLLTPDDVGASQQNKKKLKPRARQNVILELGFFLGKLGRNKVCVLYKKGVEIPSDYQGVLYIPFDPTDGWRVKLAKELKHAGFAVNLDTAL